MKTNLKIYRPERDYLRVRDFLVRTFTLVDRPMNWRLERWNYAQYFIAPILANYEQDGPDLESCFKAIQLWEELIGIWENEEGEIVAVVNIEHPDTSHPGWGEAFFQRHPEYDHLLPEMLAFVEKHLRNKEKNSLLGL